jgi:serine/threonine protein kinase/Tfp pilus assembly protein PilF
MIGETVTHYRIISKLGEGGMGVVYRGEDTRLGRQVAVKFLSARLSEDRLASERFQREARTASALNHPNICALYDIGRHGDQPFIVMELLAGSTLRQRIAHGPMPMDVVLELALQVADALDAAHSAGIIHRDIKSANIFITDRGQAKVLDFGLAKLAPQEGGFDPFADTTLAPGSPKATASGETLGTIAYMSPEQARGEELDARSDLFSFGVVLYEMATGKDPFAGRTSAVVFDKILHGTPERPCEVNPSVPYELERIIEKLLEKDRSLRYQTAAELHADLKRLRREADSGQLGTRPTGVAATSASAPVAARPGRRPALLAGTALVVLAAIAAAAYFMLWRGPGIESIAVLPFVAESQKDDTEYLTDGITETLINGLSSLPDLRVIARSVAFRYKDSKEDAQAIGRQLNVKAVVTGRITAVGDRLIIQADLMDVATGSQIWGNRYNRRAADLLAVQEEIAKEILDKVRPRLSGDGIERATKQATRSPDAYQNYLQGRYFQQKGTIESYQRAIQHFQEAINRDANYAVAWAGLADANLLLGSYWVEAITEAKTAAERALQLDPDLAEAHVSLGQIKLLLDWDWPAAEREFQRGLALNQSSALAHNAYAMYLATMNRLADAIIEVRRAQELEPLSPIVNADLGWYLLFAGQRAGAIGQFERTLEFDANSVSAHRGLGLALSEDGQHEEAIRHLRRALDLSQNSPIVIGHLAAAHARKGDSVAAQKTLNELQTLATKVYVPSSALAIVHTAIGNRTAALDLLDRAYDEHDFAMAQIHIVPWFQALRDDPRFVALKKKLNLN